MGVVGGYLVGVKQFLGINAGLFMNKIYELVDDSRTSYEGLFKAAVFGMPS